MQKIIYSLEDVSKLYQNGQETVKAIEQVSLSIREGEIFGIIGLSGAGKSTLIRMLNRLEDVTHGKILFDGKDLGKLSHKELNKIRQSIGMIFQQFHLLMQRTVLENVMLPMEIAKIPLKQRRERAREMLELVGLSEKADSYPARLSGGQKQRVAIARAISMNPRVLLCDEATSSLDPNITGEILKLLRKINETMGITIILITHEMDVVEEICHRVSIVDNGKVAETGNVEQIFTNPQTEVAKRLVYPGKDELKMPDNMDQRCVRIAFDGSVAEEPIIANLVEETGEKVSILCANTRSVGGIGYGQMLVQLPEKEEAAEKVLKYLKRTGVFVEEVEQNV